ncbi:hypothetical protein NST33_23560 [Paenibacillus sp. FSL L8-0435]|uniref:hypothetical protein n=1 Tax=Paenibacillus sp. FSL L8-0435 TaxID=2954618 RepID=UPI0030D99615
MKYSDAFFLYHIKKNEFAGDMIKSHQSYWVRYQEVDNYVCYYYYIMEYGFHEIPVWFNFHLNYAVIFVSNSDFITNVIREIEETFYFQCEVLVVEDLNQINNINIIPNAGFVLTDLLKFDYDRIKTIKKVLGDRIGYERESLHEY